MRARLLNHGGYVGIDECVGKVFTVDNHHGNVYEILEEDLLAEGADCNWIGGEGVLVFFEHELELLDD